MQVPLTSACRHGFAFAVHYALTALHSLCLTPSQMHSHVQRQLESAGLLSQFVSGCFLSFMHDLTNPASPVVQIATLMQQAICIAQPYPYVADKPRMFEVLAAARGEPSTAVITQAGGLDDFEHNANWQNVPNYLKTITRENLHIHVPFVKTQLQAG